MLRDLQTFEDKVNTVINTESSGLLIVVVSNNVRGITMRLNKVAYVPDLAFSLFSLTAVHSRGVGSTTDDSDSSVSLPDIGFWSDRSE